MYTETLSMCIDFCYKFILNKAAMRAFDLHIFCLIRPTMVEQKQTNKRKQLVNMKHSNVLIPSFEQIKKVRFRAEFFKAQLS